MTDLKPCPFCGNDEIILETPLGNVGPQYASCSDEKCCGYAISAAAWNTRAENEALNLRIAELEALATDLAGALEPFAKHANKLRPDDLDTQRPAYATAQAYRGALAALYLYQTRETDR